MFSMNLCGTDPSNTIRAVCFSEGMFTKFAPNRTYDLQGFKVKKGYGKSNSTVELLIDNETNVSASHSQLTLEEKSFTISQILEKQCDNVRFIKLQAKVMKIEELNVVGTYPDNKAKRNIHLADETGRMQLVLWRDRAENVEFNVGNVLCIQNAVMSIHGHTLNLTTTFETSFTKLDQVMTVAAATEPSLNSNSVFLTSSILAIKEFSCKYSCIGCRKDIDSNGSEDSIIVTCPTCSSMFLRELAVPTNRCQILLNNKQWFQIYGDVSFTV